MKTIDDNIEQTLEKLCSLLSYSNLSIAETVLAAIKRAKTMWKEHRQDNNKIINLYEN